MAICHICQHSNRNAVDDALLAGGSGRAVAAQFGLSKSGVARHRSGCLQPKIAAAARMVAPAAEVRAEVQRAKAIVSGEVVASHEDVLSLTGLLDRLARSLTRLESAADTAASDGLHMPLAALSGQLHKGIEVAAKVQGLYADTPTDPNTRFSITISLPSGDVMKAGPKNITPSQDQTPATPPALSLRFADPVD
jgi:hypothetical protein